MYRMNAIYSGMRYVGVPLRADLSLDAEAMLAAIERDRPALVFLAYPNNPTGNLFDESVLERIIAATPGLVVIDEAYQAFAGASFLPKIGRYANVVLLRTVSKVGMAGLRLGYAIADPAWTHEIDKLRPPYNLNVFTQAVAPVLLAERELLAAQAAEICSERARLEAALAALPGVAVYPTRTNFVLVRVPDANRWFAALLDAGILVKNVDAWHPLLVRCLRITVGTPRENDLLLAAMGNLQ
jgi:histidinol-phosphate aminotransferase